MNKHHMGEVNDLDIAQLDCLLPTIAEIIRAADDHMRVVSISAGLNKHMGEMQASV